MLVVVGLPVVGLFLHLFRICVLTADDSFLKLFGLHRQAASCIRGDARHRRRSTGP